MDRPTRIVYKAKPARVFWFLLVVSIGLIVAFGGSVLGDSGINRGSLLMVVFIAVPLGTLSPLGFLAALLLRWWREGRGIKRLFESHILASWIFDDARIWFGVQGVYNEKWGYETLIRWQDPKYYPASGTASPTDSGLGIWSMSKKQRANFNSEYGDDSVGHIIFHQPYFIKGKHGTYAKMFPVAPDHEAEAQALVDRYRKRLLKT